MYELVEYDERSVELLEAEENGVVVVDWATVFSMLADDVNIEGLQLDNNRIITDDGVVVYEGESEEDDE